MNKQLISFQNKSVSVQAPAGNEDQKEPTSYATSACQSPRQHAVFSHMRRGSRDARVCKGSWAGILVCVRMKMTLRSSVESCWNAVQQLMFWKSFFCAYAGALIKTCTWLGPRKQVRVPPKTSNIEAPRALWPAAAKGNGVKERVSL